MKLPEIVAWIMIAITFARGLFVWDMGPSAANTNPVASAICLAGSAIGAALVAVSRNGARND